MKRKTQLMAVGIVVIVCMASFLYWMCVLHPSINAGSSYPPTAALTTPVKDDDNYTIRIISINTPINPSKVEWLLLNENDVCFVKGDFPVKSEYEGSVVNVTAENITIVTWFDNDHDGKVSTNDSIRIYRLGDALEGCKLLLRTGYWTICSVRFQD